MIETPDWFPKFLADHQAAHPRPDWPRYPSAFYQMWIDNFWLHCFTEEDAYLASDCMSSYPPVAPDQHLTGLLDARREITCNRNGWPVTPAGPTRFHHLPAVADPIDPETF